VRESQLVEELRKLPLQPSSVTRVLAVLDDPAHGAADVARAIAPDVGLCARILRLANSPYFGAAGRVGSIDRAVMTVGFSVVRSLAITTAAGLVGDKAPVPQGFWAHSGAVAMASSLIAKRWRLPAADALCAGLLHDVGAALAYRHDPAGYTQVVAGGPDDLLAAETEAFGADHAELGAIALHAWRLPDTIVDAVRAHHAVPADGAPTLSHVVVAAEALVRDALGDANVPLVEPEGDAGTLGRLGLSDGEVEDLRRHIEDDGDGLGSLLVAA
jgi:putative nucleotidyltransferase with HDIG domain